LQGKRKDTWWADKDWEEEKKVTPHSFIEETTMSQGGVAKLEKN